MKYRIIEEREPTNATYYYLERKGWFGWRRLNVQWGFYSGSPEMKFPTPDDARLAIKHLERARRVVYEYIEA